MSNVQQGENKPPRPAPDGQSKKRLDVVLAHVDGEAYEIPMDVARQYPSSDDHDLPSGEEDEVEGRHQVYSPARNRFEYHTEWRTGQYIWLTDGRAYRGPHWHPYPHSPIARVASDDPY